MDQLTVTAGVFPDVTSGNGYTWLIARVGDPRVAGAIVVYTWEAEYLFTMRELHRWSIGPGTPGFPRIYFDPATAVLWFASTDGHTATLTNASSGEVWALSPCENNDPFCFGHGWFAWQGSQAAGWPITRVQLATQEAAAAGWGAGTGLSRILEDGTIVLVDEDRRAEPGGTRPCWAADLVVLEDDSNFGALGRLDDGRDRLLWPTVQIITPRCSYEPTAARYAIVGWSSDDGHIRAAVLTAEEFGVRPDPEPQPPEPQPPEPEPPIMILPDHVFATLQQQRSRFGASPTDPELGIILNDTAWAHKGEGWGVNTKTSGANCPQPGEPPGMIAHDILHHQPTNMIFDCLYAAGSGGPATPVKGEGSVMTITERPWRAPNSPTGGPTPPPDTSDLERRIANCETQIADLTAQLRALEEEAVVFGARIALRMHSNKLIMPLPDGGPTGDRQRIEFETRSDPGPWESLKVERGTE